MSDTTKIIKKLFPGDWLEICSLAEDGVPVKKLAEKYDVDESVIYKGLKKRRVNIGAAQLKVEQEHANKLKLDLIARIRETKDKDYRFTEFLQTQIIKTVTDTQRAGKPLGSAIDDIKALKIAIDGVRGGTDNKWRLLGLDKENEHADDTLPELPIRELSPAEETALRDKQAAEDGLDEEDLAALAEIEALASDEEDEAIVEESE